MKDKMKKRLCVLLAAVMVLGLLSACGRTETDEEDNNDIELDDTLSGEALTAGAAADKVFSLAVDLGERQTLNPIRTRSTLNQLVDNLVYDRLFEVDANFNVTSRILDDWYYSNGMWVLTVRKDIQMHDGSMLSPADIAYSISRIFNSGSTYYQAQTGTVYSAVFQGQVILSGDFENQLLPLRLSIPIIKSADGSINENVPVGSGPYMYSEDLTCLEKFDGYENADALPLDTIYLRPYTGPEGLITEYESALVDLVINDSTSIYNMGYGGINERRAYPTTNMHFICFNSESQFFQFDMYRYAMNWIINRERIADTVLDGKLTASALPIHPNSPLFDRAANDELAYDAERFRQELERGGCRDLDGDGMLEYAYSGAKMEIDLNFVVCADSAAKVQVAREIAQAMESVGVSVHLRELTWNEYLAALAGPDEDDKDDEDDAFDWTWDMYYGEIALTPDWNTLTLFSGDRVKDNTLNYGKWRFPTMEQSVYELLAASEDDRPAAVQNMLSLMAENSVFLPIGFEVREVISHLGVIKGLEPNQYNPLANVAKWTVNLE